MLRVGAVIGVFNFAMFRLSPAKNASSAPTSLPVQIPQAASFADAGAVMGDDLSPQKARILLMLMLHAGVTGQKRLQAAFDR